MNHSHIRSTEKKLIKSFMLSAFVFLLAFEGIFLGSRYFFERNNYEKTFIEDTNIITWRSIHKSRGIHSMRIGILIVNHYNTIIKSYIPDIQVWQNIDGILKNVSKISDEKVHYIEWNMVRKISFPSETFYLFTTALNEAQIFRDIFRFLIFDFLLLFPIWFLIRRYIKHILQPVRENLDTMTHFVHDAWHELKTPLAIMSWNLQIMRDSNHIDYELIEESLNTIDIMNESIQWLLELADLKAPNKQSKNCIYELVEQEISRIKNPHQIKIHNNLSEKTYILWDKHHISIILRNIIENAVKYNKPQWEVFIEFSKNTLTIRDTGIGIKNEDLKHIFDRFYRINKNSEVSGSWIWLTLVEKIIKLYWWKISIQSEINIGTTISISF